MSPLVRTMLIVMNAVGLLGGVILLIYSHNVAPASVERRAAILDEAGAIVADKLCEFEPEWAGNTNREAGTWIAADALDTLDLASTILILVTGGTAMILLLTGYIERHWARRQKRGPLQS